MSQGSRSTPVWRRIGTSSVEGQSGGDAVVIVGGGPVGLTVALDLGRRGHHVIVVNRLDYIPAGSRAICFSKRSIEIFDRLGIGEALVSKGVAWNVGKVFWGDEPEPIYQFDLLPLKDQHRPAFINIQQYHVEELLVQAVSSLKNVELRWGHRAVGVKTNSSGVTLDVLAQETSYSLTADYLIACDGSRSSVREFLGLDFQGRVFEENFLIADIRMRGERPAERWFWFDPPFNRGQSALMHKQPDDVWRLDFQLGWDIDRAAAVQPQNVEKYVRAMLGPDVQFEREWYSVYIFQCCRMSRFVHDRVIFAGDSAHLVSPFGARGCNGGIADADNLCWKLHAVRTGQAGPHLLESYNSEAVVTADENILQSSRSTDFMTPKSPTSRAFRDAVLELAAEFSFARPFVNSGRLSTAVAYPDSPLNTADVDAWSGGISPGSPAVDAPWEDGWLLDRLGERFVLLTSDWHGTPPPNVDILDVAGVATDPTALQERYELTAGAGYLFRPDQYVAARWKRVSAARVAAACQRALGH